MPADNNSPPRRSRTTSLPAASPSSQQQAELIKRPQSPLHISSSSLSSSDIEEENFEADDETSRNSTRRLSSVAKEEIAQARRLSQKISGDDLISEKEKEERSGKTSSIQSSKESVSLFGSIYSFGGAVWNFIRGPIETDSNDELTTSYRRNKSKSFSATSPSNSSSKKSPPKLFIDDSSDDAAVHSDTSEAPDFDLPIKNDTDMAAAVKLKTGVEIGRDKIVFKEVSGGNENNVSCNLIGREFPEIEHVLTSKDISTLQSQIPKRWNAYNDWILLYSTRGNGFSLTTLYHQLKPFKGPVLLAIKDEFGKIFGAFLNQSLQPRQGHYGNGECFLWRKNLETGTFTKYPSTGKNNYFIISEPEYLAIGCGGGKFGLWLEKELFKGISDPVPTFDNEALASNQKFECIALEIWGLDLNE